MNFRKHNVEKELLWVSESIEEKSFIINDIAKYKKFWNSNMALNAIYVVEMSCFVVYWDRIYKEIIGPLLS